MRSSRFPGCKRWIRPAYWITVPFHVEPHRLGQQERRHVSGIVCRDGRREKEPGVRTIPGSRSLDGRGKGMGAAGLDKGCDIVHPGRLVEVQDDKPTRIVV